MHHLNVRLGSHGNDPRNRVELDGRALHIKSLDVRAAVGKTTQVVVTADVDSLELQVENVMPRGVKTAPSYFEHMGQHA